MDSIVKVLANPLARGHMKLEEFSSLALYWKQGLENANYFDLLGIPEANCSSDNQKALKEFYRKFMLMFHPDKLGYCTPLCRKVMEVITQTVSGAVGTVLNAEQLEKYKAQLSREKAVKKSGASYVVPDSLRLEPYNPSWKVFLAMTDPLKIQEFVRDLATVNNPLLLAETEGGDGIFEHCLTRDLKIHAKALLLDRHFLSKIDFGTQEKIVTFYLQKTYEDVRWFYSQIQEILHLLTNAEITEFYRNLKSVFQKLDKHYVSRNGLMLLLSLDQRLFQQYLQEPEQFINSSYRHNWLENADSYIRFGLVEPLKRLLSHYRLPAIVNVEKSDPLIYMICELRHCPVAELNQMMQLLIEANFPFNYTSFNVYQRGVGENERKRIPNLAQAALLWRYGFLINFSDFPSINQEENYQNIYFRKAIRIYGPLLAMYKLTMNIAKVNGVDLELINDEFIRQISATAPAPDKEDERDFFALVTLIFNNLKKTFAADHAVFCDNMLVLAAGIFGKFNMTVCPQRMYQQCYQVIISEPQFPYLMGAYRFKSQDEADVLIPVVYVKMDASILKMITLAEIDTIPASCYQGLWSTRLIPQESMQHYLETPAVATNASSTTSTSQITLPAQESVCTNATAALPAPEIPEQSIRITNEIKQVYLQNYKSTSAIGQLHEAILNADPLPENWAKLANATTLMCAYLVGDRPLISALQAMQIPVNQTTADLAFLLGDESLWNTFMNYAPTHSVPADIQNSVTQMLSQTVKTMIAIGMVQSANHRHTIDAKMDSQVFAQAVTTVLAQHQQANAPNAEVDEHEAESVRSQTSTAFN